MFRRYELEVLAVPIAVLVSIGAAIGIRAWVADQNMDPNLTTVEVGQEPIRIPGTEFRPSAQDRNVVHLDENTPRGLTLEEGTTTIVAKCDRHDDNTYHLDLRGVDEDINVGVGQAADAIGYTYDVTAARQSNGGMRISNHCDGGKHSAEFEFFVRMAR